MMPDLGKYAATVLTAYGASILLLAGLIWLSIRAARKSRKTLEDLERKRG